MLTAPTLLLGLLVCLCVLIGACIPRSDESTNCLVVCLLGTFVVILLSLAAGVSFYGAGRFDGNVEALTGHPRVTLVDADDGSRSWQWNSTTKPTN